MERGIVHNKGAMLSIHNYMGIVKLYEYKLIIQANFPEQFKQCHCPQTKFMS